MPGMLEYLHLLVAAVGAALRIRSDLVAENLYLRQQLAVLTRPTRKRPRLRARDKLFWPVVGVFRRDWRRHFVLVRPETVVRWHRRGWLSCSGTSSPPLFTHIATAAGDPGSGGPAPQPAPRPGGRRNRGGARCG